MTATDTVKATETRHQGAAVVGGDQSVADAGGVTSPAPTESHTTTPSMFRARGEQLVLVATILFPFAALVAAVPLLWDHWITWRDVILAAVMYAITGHGVTVGFHRYFTHRGFKTSKPVRAALAIAGNMAIEGPVIRWVADHRRHHAFSDADGDPHSPWRYGTGPAALARGLWHAHVGWLFDVEQTDQRRYAPDLLDDPMIVRVSRSFALCAFVSLALPAVIGGLWGGSFEAALQAFFWASLVRVALLHHVTWSVNSICHVMGSRPYRSRDRSGNVWPLALLSMGESWHNLHHAEPTSARHGVRPWQIDTSFYVIKTLEILGLARDVRWPDPARLAAKRA
ncbi:fatty acid desaturase [Frankia sp. Mgl5]|uniref:Stearoyl-CoA 9-desaturase n=1 Tax=Parafrankia soli TaxID=2599596 RepID=A0A1S1RN92_9ACTN|nr:MULTISPECIES: fatty acid desaturase [Frankiaceae]ABW10229.1 Stearoyl-CoA 9-desaturase [Frankia sp. EAN1pec]CAI7977166.1 stearoyl-CoA desaturase (Delta-9 desaturase) [Frankia sp. Hr75.2]MCK9930121.1 fatty acid desaturase [Frankia sp. Mgl5]OHV46762.1 stearoyl-CoA 9-desaturase [Parafrankia soli]TCJ36811.1 acyl-CoA desaturase [Parafrankia sp. BMG5.11]